MHHFQLRYRHLFVTKLRCAKAIKTNLKAARPVIKTRLNLPRPDENKAPCGPLKARLSGWTRRFCLRLNQLLQFCPSFSSLAGNNIGYHHLILPRISRGAPRLRGSSTAATGASENFYWLPVAGRTNQCVCDGLIGPAANAAAHASRLG
jgi:hypothetical protein